MRTDREPVTASGAPKSPRRPPETLREMSFFGHLDELRKVLVQSSLALFAAIVGCWFFSRQVLDLLTADIPIESLYFTSPTEAFMVRLKLSAVLGAMLAFPFVLLKVWAFVAPGLFSHEKRRVYPVLVGSAVLFYGGVLFCYLVLIPHLLQFFLGYGTERLKPLLTVGSYFAFVARMSFTFGVVFQLPIVVLVLSALGVVSPRFLARQWRYAVLGIFIACAILTPPDAVSLLVMAVPVALLYALSVMLAFVVVKRKDRAARADEARSR